MQNLNAKTSRIKAFSRKKLQISREPQLPLKFWFVFDFNDNFKYFKNILILAVVAKISKIPSIWRTVTEAVAAAEGPMRRRLRRHRQQPVAVLLGGRRHRSVALNQPSIPPCRSASAAAADS